MEIPSIDGEPTEPSAPFLDSDTPPRASPPPKATQPYYHHFPLSWKIPVGKDRKTYSIGKLGEKRNKESIGEFDTRKAPRTLLEYKPEADPHLRGYFQNPEVKKHLQDQNLITADNRVVCSLKDFNTFRIYMHERNTKQVQKIKDIEKELLFGRKNSLLDEDEFFYNRKRAMKSVLEQLKARHRGLEIAEDQLESLRYEYSLLLRKGVLSADLMAEGQREIKTREKIVERKLAEFDDMLTWLEEVENIFQQQLAARNHEDMEKVTQKRNSFQIRHYFQTLREEENDFRQAVEIFERTQKVDERMELSREQHRRLATNIYNHLVSLRQKRKRKEQRLLMELMRRLDRLFGGLNTAIATMSSSELDNIGTGDRPPEAEFHQFMAETTSVNVHPPAENLTHIWLRLNQREKILGDTKTASYEDIVLSDSNDHSYNEFLIKASPHVIKHCTKTMAKSIAKRRLTYNFEQPFDHILYGMKRFKAPGVKAVKQGMLKQKRSNQNSLITPSLAVSTESPQSSKDKDVPKTNFWSQKKHTCQSYVNLLQLRAKQERERNAHHKARELSLEDWNIGIKHRKLPSNSAAAANRNKVGRRPGTGSTTESRTTTRTATTTRTTTTATKDSHFTIDFSAIRGYVPTWARPTCGAACVPRSTSEDSRLHDFDSQNSTSTDTTNITRGTIPARKPRAKSAGAMRRDGFAKSEHPIETAGTKNTGIVPTANQMVDKRKQIIKPKGQTKVDQLMKPFRLSKSQIHQSLRKRVREQTPPRKPEEKEELEDDEKVAANREYKKFTRKLNGYVESCQRKNKRITASEIKFMQRLGKLGVTFSELVHSDSDDDVPVTKKK